MKILPLLANGLWVLSSLPSAVRFQMGLDRVRDVQRDGLLRILRRNAATPFGIAHDFDSIRSIRDFQSRVPVRTWDQYTELHDGDAKAVTVSTVEHMEPTSGSSGAVKRIPYTRDLRRELGNAIAPWVVGLFLTHPRAMAGEAYWSISPLANDDAYEGDEEYLGRFRGRVVRSVQAVPRSIRHIRDLGTFRRATLLHLLRCRSLALISVWHPSFLLTLMAQVRTIDPEQIPDARRAAEVRVAFESHADDAAMHCALWPRLRVISCWADANAAASAGEVARLFPQAHVQAKGLLSTEGFVSLPLPGAAAPALAYRSHFVELQSEENGEIVIAADAEEGNRYGVVLTTGGGLYRYATEDLVEIVGFHRSCPLIRFIGRTRHVSDHFGEKLNEVFVRERLERALEEAAVASRFAMLACDGRAYTLFIESDASEGALTRAASTLETALRDSFHYDHCRRLGQLEPLAVFRTEHGSTATYLDLLAESQRLGDIKPAALDPRRGWSDKLEGVWVVRQGLPS